MERQNAMDELWFTMDICGVSGYFNDMRIEPETVPEGFHFYELQDGDSNGEPCQYQSTILENFVGTFISKEKLPENNEGFFSSEEWGFTGDSLMLSKIKFNELENIKEQLARSQTCDEISAVNSRFHSLVAQHNEIFTDIEIKRIDADIQSKLRESGNDSRKGINEKITLYIKYTEPVNFNGFHIEKDTITFDNVESVIAFANGEVAYDILDNAVRKRDNEILLFAENESGQVVWGIKEEPELECDVNVNTMKRRGR